MTNPLTTHWANAFAERLSFAFGLTISKVRVEDGRERVKCGLRRSHSELDVLLQDQHEGYVTWSEFERTSV